MTQKRWSLSVPIEEVPLAEHAEIAREAEQLGYTDAWSLEVDGIDCFSPLAVIGSATQLRLGTAIANVYTRGPATLAMTAAGLAEVAPGRFCLGVGAGSQPIVESWNGGTFSRPATRVRETVEFLRRVFAGERVVFEGETFTVQGFRLSTRFATFWVEHGEIQAPVNVMRFDETLYRVLGDNLLGLTAERSFLLDPSTYHARSTNSVRVPGALVGDFTFTL